MSDRDGQFEIYLMERDGSNPVNLTQNEAIDGIPVWSQQANAFAFLTDRDTNSLAIYRMNDTGESVQELTVDPPANAGQPYWSPTGKLIAFGTGETDPLTGNPASIDIYIMNEFGQDLVNLTNSPDNDRFAAWSPDGQSILFTSDRTGESGIFVVDVNGGEPSMLTEPETPAATPAWSPDGTKIAYVSIVDDDIEIFVMDADGGNQTRLTNSPGIDAFPAWSPDGTQIAFLSYRDENPEIYLMASDGSNQTNLTDNPSQEAVQGDFSWSPDGSQILFHTDRDGNIEVYSMNADGSEQTNLTQNPSSDLASIWVP